MRNVFLVLLAASALSGGASAADEPRQPKTDVGNGHIAWFDITTKDMARAKEFYGGLFGWTFVPFEGTDLAVNIACAGETIGTLRVAEGDLSPYDGVVYVQVADMRASCQKAKDLGGVIPPGFPFDLDGDGGAVALVLDPIGHPVGMYSRTPLAAESR
jgi:predicted enzyme related to lactoylglutathione lyase